MKKTYLSWEDVYKRASSLVESLRVPKGCKIFGVPKGGAILAGYMASWFGFELTPYPEKALFAVDDLIDSGRTKQKYQDTFELAFFALVDKSKESNLGWVVFPWESETDQEDIIVRTIEAIGENPNREGLIDTPKRVIKMWDEIFAGYKQKPAEILKANFDTDGYDSIVLLRDIELYSMCEHHMLPFVGKAHVAYLPNKRVVGISKLARLVDCFAKRLQIQERLGEQVTEALMTVLDAKAACCIIEAQHLCMKMRGVEKQNSVMVTSSMKGAFREDARLRAELMSLINSPRSFT